MSLLYLHILLYFDDFAVLPLISALQFSRICCSSGEKGELVRKARVSNRKSVSDDPSGSVPSDRIAGLAVTKLSSEKPLGSHF